ncbi:unnamed protein product, partial [Rotaria sp. Silwood2]
STICLQLFEDDEVDQEGFGVVGVVIRRPAPA